MKAGVLAVLGTLWAAFLLPPEVVVWYGRGEAPGWARAVADAPVYDLILRAGDAVGLSDPYKLFGAGVAPAFFLIGLSLLLSTRRLGWAGSLLSGSTLFGTVLVVVSYAAAESEPPWRYLWGSEALLLVLMGLAGIVAGVVAFRQPDVPRWWALLLGCSIVVLAASTVLTGYFPHGSLILFGVEAAILGLAAPDRLP